MAMPLVDEVGRFLDRLETTQKDLARVYGQKRSALVRADAGELNRLAQAEGELVERLRALLNERRRILEEAARVGYSCATLHRLVGLLAGNKRGVWQARINRAQEALRRLQREGWTHWIIANRACHHYTEVLELIAHCGEKAPTYGQRTEQPATGGAILDASI